MTRRQFEGWHEHRERLEKYHTSRRNRPEYNVVFRVLNAANYGVPQRRERVFLVGFRSDLGSEWSFPPESHSEDALMHDQWVTGEYWDRHDIPRRQCPHPSPRQLARTARILRGSGRLFGGNLPWLTVRRTLSHARQQQRLRNHLELLRNFVRPHRALEFGREVRTPGMQAGLTSRPQTLRDIFTSIPTYLRLIRIVWEFILEANSIDWEVPAISEAV